MVTRPCAHGDSFVKVAERKEGLDPAAVAVAGGVFFLCMVNLEQAIRGIFASSLASLSVNLSLVSVPLLLTGFLYPLGLGRAWPHKRGFLAACMVLAIACTVASLMRSTTVAILAAASATAFLTPLAAFMVGSQPLATVAGLAGGTAVHVALRAVNGTAVLASTGLGRATLLVVVFGFVVAGVGFLRGPTSEATESRLAPLGLAAFFAFLFFEYQLVGSPSALDTLHGAGDVSDYLALAVGLQLGLAAGVYITIDRLPRADGGLLAGVLVTYAISTVCLLLGWAHVLAPLWVFLAQLTAVVLVRECMSKEPVSEIKRAASLAGVIQLSWLFLLVFHAFAPRWPFLPRLLWPVLEGQATVYLLLSYGLLPALVVVGFRKRATR